MLDGHDREEVLGEVIVGLITFSPHFEQKADMEKREQKLDVLQDRVAELKERAKLQETPIQMQVNIGGNSEDPI